MSPGFQLLSMAASVGGAQKQEDVAGTGAEDEIAVRHRLVIARRRMRNLPPLPPSGPAKPTSPKKAFPPIVGLASRRFFQTGRTLYPEPNVFSEPTFMPSVLISAHR